MADTMDEALIDRLGDELYDALRARRTLAPLTERHPAIAVDDAYRISLRFLARREADGERVTGKKIGVTSKAVQDMLGVFQPDFGFLTDRMQVADGTTVSLAGAGLIQPRAEGTFITDRAACVCMAAIGARSAMISSVSSAGSNSCSRITSRIASGPLRPAL